MRQAPITTINALSAAATAVSPQAISTRNLLQISVQVITTGSAAGVLKLQASNDITSATVPPTAPTHWSDIPSASIACPSAGSYLIPKTEICYEFVRAVWTPTASDVGTVTANAQVLGV